MNHSIHRSAGLATAAIVLMAAIAPTAAQAQRRGEPLLRVSYATDATLTCEQLIDEIARMEEIAGISAQNAQNAQTQGAIVDGAASVAVTAALHTGVLGAVPGLGMFANAAGQAARRNAEARARAEAERIQVAEQRHTLLTGIYQGRQCAAPTAPAATIAAVAAVPSPEEPTSSPAAANAEAVAAVAPAEPRAEGADGDR